MDQKITDLDIAISMSASDLIPIVDSNGDNKVLHGSQVKDYVADAVVSDIDDVKAMISDEYDNTATYAVGDYCIYNNTLYRCTTDISTAEDFTPAHWTETTIDAELALANSAINEINNKVNNYVIIDNVQLFSNVQIPNNTEYNSNGSTIPHVTIPSKTGYTPIAVINTQAIGYYGSRILVYAWIDTGDNKIHFSAYNPMENFQYTPNTTAYAWILYRKN